MTPHITMIGGHVAFDGRQILCDAAMSLERGSVYAVIGRSGSGKTTLLRALCGLVPLVSGKVQLDGEPIIEGPTLLMEGWSIRRRVAYVAQQPTLLPYMTALANLILPLTVVGGMSKPKAHESVVSTAASLGLSAETLQRYPEQLSGGEVQRVQLLRAMMLRPEVLLLDEVTANVDPMTTADIMDTLWKLRAQAPAGQTIAIVTHLMSFAQAFADRIGFMHGGRIHEEGLASEFVRDARTPEARRFLDAAQSAVLEGGRHGS